MAKLMHKGRRNAVKTVAHKAMAGRSASVMNPECLAEIRRVQTRWRCISICSKDESVSSRSEEVRYYMCEAMENIEARGEARGKRETMFATARRMLKDGFLALKDIARYSVLSLAQVKKLQASMA